METLKVTFTFDLAEVNESLGNTPNVQAKTALEELLRSLLTQFDDYNDSGHPTNFAPVLEKMTFKIEGDHQ